MATTVLNSWQQVHGALMVKHLGYTMPYAYQGFSPAATHEHTRSRVSLSDMSYRTCIDIFGKHRVKFLDSILPSSISNLPPNGGKASVLTNENGGIEDNLVVIRLGDRLRLLVNGLNKDKDLAILQQHRADMKEESGVVLQPMEPTVLSLQGPMAESVLADLSAHGKSSPHFDVSKLWHMRAFASHWRLFPKGCQKFVILRAGITGEDGFYIFTDNRNAEVIIEMLMSHPEMMLLGVGAAESLRVEAGYCLYGNELDARTTPGAAGLTWMLSKAKLMDEANPIPGRAIMLSELSDPTSIQRKRIGLKGLSKGSAPQKGEKVFLNETDTSAVGVITSGEYSPTLDATIAMAYVDQGARKTKRLWVGDRKKPMSLGTFPMVDTHLKMAVAEISNHSKIIK